MGQLPSSCLDKLLDAMAGSTFKVCKDQTYALCAAARCNLRRRRLLSVRKESTATALACRFRRWAWTCARVQRRGADNKYMVSTYSLPHRIPSPQGGGGVYSLRSRVETRGGLRPMRWGLCFPQSSETNVPLSQTSQKPR